VYFVSGGASAAKEPGHLEVRISSSQVTQMHFFLKKVDDPFLVVALKTQRPPTPLRLFRCQNKKQIKQSAVRYGKIFIFCSHYYQSKAIGRAEPGLEPGQWIFQPGHHLTWHALV